MKMAIVPWLATLAISCKSSATNCVSESFYDMDSVAKFAKVQNCYFMDLESIPGPHTSADRQFNYFASKLNEYARLFGAKSIDTASLEYMFYPEVLKGGLSADDSRDIEFTYIQAYSCVSESGKTVVKSLPITVRGTVGATGVCLTANTKVCSSLL